MPLILITGIPSSGKTTRTNELKTYFEQMGKQVHVISEADQITQAKLTKNATYLGKYKLYGTYLILIQLKLTISKK